MQKSSCEICHQRCECAALAAVLDAVEKYRDEGFDPEFLATYDRLVARLRAAGWCYPNGSPACHLMQADAALRAMAAELTSAWKREAESLARRGAAPNLLADETYRE